MHWPAESRENAIVPGAGGVRNEEVEPRDLALDASGELAQLDVHLGLLPEHHVVLEHHALLANLDLELRARVRRVCGR